MLTEPATGSGAVDGLQGQGQTGLYATTNASNGTAVFGAETTGTGNAAFFSGGSGGTGHRSYNGGSGWNCTSDRNLKEHFADVDLPQLLERAAHLEDRLARLESARASGPVVPASRNARWQAAPADHPNASSSGLTPPESGP